jgi:hypothetical protein
MVPGGSVVAENIKQRFDAALVRYDAWFVVAIGVLIVLAGALFLGMTVWCVVYQRKHFTGAWSFKNGWSVNVQCN